MNRISGRVILKESGAGIADVLVVIYDLDQSPQDNHDRNARSTVPSASLGDRIGSVLTGKNGAFELTYEDDEYRGQRTPERRPDLRLQVLSPEEPGQSSDANLLFTTDVVRHNAGKTEQYLVRIPSELLKKAGVEIPSLLDDANTETATGRVQRIKDAGIRADAIIDGAIEVARARVDAHRTRFKTFSDRLKSSLSDSLSTVSSSGVDPQRLVRPGKSPRTKNVAVIEDNIRNIINSNDPSVRAPANGFISLTSAQLGALQGLTDGDGSVTEDQMSSVIGAETSSAVLDRNELLPLCRARTTATDALDQLLDGQPDSDSDDDTDTDTDIDADTDTDTDTDTDPNSDADAGAITSDDIPLLMGRMLNSLTAPEEQLLTGLTPTATLTSVQQSVRDLQLQPSPADTPAFHDFHQLQIAFQHVWQELTDQGVLDIAADAYETIVELGGDLTRGGNVRPIEALRREGTLVLRAARTFPPPIIRDHRDGDDNDPWTPSGGATTRPPVQNPPVNGASSTSEPSVRLPALLTALEARLREKYSFTVFAANAKERSVNFGILNTFRQIWTPLSYQAGPLIKSIPLAPKQTQKVVVTRKVSKKRHQKELETNLRVIKEETSQTSRAEQEIAKRASSKTEFSFSNSATGGVEGVGSNTTTTTMKQDATKSSSDIKKAFHESVFKSAQEFKNERVTEITTDSLEENETTETTEISNPNDEIAVTYLFYELQRRYRLHERLQRVTPVVMVAQEVPAPHEIDQDWLVAHDWILKRIILDDSFLPTLETISQSAGTAAAIKQLAANVGQQRQIVEQLRRELAIARRTADVRTTLVQGAVNQQTGSDGLLDPVVTALTGAVGSAVNAVGDLLFGGSPEENQSNQNVIKNSTDEAADRARELLFRLEREVTALNALTETYAKALREYHTHITEIARLRVHVKENILHYMQGIWRYEHPDQRYFRLHNVAIPVIKKPKRRFVVDFDNLAATSSVRAHTTLPRFGGRDAQTYPVRIFCTIPDKLEFKPLCEVAELDNLLGFKGNYMLFPLLESNALTDHMMDPYIDRATNELVDPSDPAGYSLDDFADYVLCLKEELTRDEFERLRPKLQEQYRQIISNPRRDDDVLVVPTNSLFIEALPASHALIERYKKDHRMIDVKRAQSEVRERELENIRRAARILEGERGDPNIDKRVVIEGNASPVVET